MANEEIRQAFSCEATAPVKYFTGMRGLFVIKRFSEKPSSLLRGLPTMTQPQVAGRMLVTPRYRLSLWCNRFLGLMGTCQSCHMLDSHHQLLQVSESQWKISSTENNIRSQCYLMGLG